MTAKIDTLFQPFTIKSLELKNRIVMAPMTRVFSPGGIPGDNVASYYRRRAEADIGLILSEGTVVDRPAARNEEAIPTFHGEKALAGWSNVIKEVHKVGGKMGPQIWHVGAVGSSYGWVADGAVDSPSGLLKPDNPNGKPMSLEDIADTIAAFARAASDAKRLGFDVLEIHGAHGYLIDEFFWAGTNVRSDRYGGETLAERAQFATEIVGAMRKAVGLDFPIILRISQWKQQDLAVKLADTPDAIGEWLLPLKEAGVDIFHCSQRRFWEPEFPEIDGTEGLNFAGWVKKVTGAPTISVGSVGLSGEVMAAFGGESSSPMGLDNLIRRMESEEFDLIAVGRAILADPFWAAKIKAGKFEELQDFNPASFAQLV